MKAASLVLPLCMGVGALNAQDAKQIADSLPVPTLQKGATSLPVPEVNGAKVSLFCVDYDQYIDKDGKITRQPLSDVPLLVAYKVEKDGQTEISRDYPLTLLAGNAPEEGANPKPATIPAILEWRGAKGEYKLGKKITVSNCDDRLFKLLARDFKNLLGAELVLVGADEKADIAFGKTGGDESEKYTLKIGKKGILISASGDRGQLWATRTLLQILSQTGGSVPCGEACDVPRYKLRGFMLDIARIPVPLDVIKDVIRTMSWYKLNDLHLVINNNYIFHENYVDSGRDPFKESYSAFRLESDIKGSDGTPLTAQDLSFTKKEFMELVDYAKAYGVTIVPEFDAPGHALSFTRVRPDLVYKGPMNVDKRRCEMLDAANPETIAFMGEVFDEYLLPDPSLGSKAVLGECPVVHVGADEFFGDKEDYRKYIDGIMKHVKSRKYTPRIWGSLNKKPGNTPVVSEGVQMNLWNGSWAKAWDSVKQGYDVINTNDGALYIVPFADYYRMDKNTRWVYNHFKPNHIAQEVLPAGHPQLLGATYALWNDMMDLKHNGYCMFDTWASLANPMHVVSQRFWGPEAAPDTFEQHNRLADAIGDAPGLEIRHRWTDNTTFALQPAKLPVKLGRPDLGPDYHLEMELEISEVKEGEEQVLLDGPQGQLLAVMKDGTVGFRRADTMVFSFETKLPVGRKFKLEIIGTPGNTKLLVDGQSVGTLTLKTYHNKQTNLVATLILPMQTLGSSLKGKVYGMRVTPSKASDSKEVIIKDAQPTAVPD